MKTIIFSTLPVLFFTGSVILVFYLYLRLWMVWVYRKIRKKNTKRFLTRPAAIALHIIVGIGLISILYGYFVEPYWLEINTISIQTNKLENTSFRIVQISDLHCDKKVRLEPKLSDIINNLNPDVIVFTGDSINYSTALPLFQNTLSSLKAPLGKFAVSGNWDAMYFSNLKLFENTGFQELRVHEITIEKNGEFVSVSGLAFENAKSIQRIADMLSPETFNMFLYHNTDIIEYFDNIPVDLYLSGHTHGGQVALPFYGALTTLSRHGKKYETGLYRRGHIQVYVNRGIGLEGGHAPRVRFVARPEIVVFDIGPEIKSEIKE